MLAAHALDSSTIPANKQSQDDDNDVENENENGDEEAQVQAALSSSSPAASPGPTHPSSSSSTAQDPTTMAAATATPTATATPMRHASPILLPLTKSRAYTGSAPPMPECWGHRGASGAFPENTLASFERAVQDGSEGIESDVHITSDDVIVMFHDPSLERTTNGRGLIREQKYYGAEGIEHVRTTKQPVQKIPTFQELCDFLMRDECRHVKANIDIKADNDPERLFVLMKQIVSQYPSYSTALSPRLILGLWHPKFLTAALKHVPELQRIHIGGSPSRARKHFWDQCSGFSMSFPSLVGAEGQAFIRDAQLAGKHVYVWTVNRPDEMIEATRWGVAAVLTDNTEMFRELREEMARDFAGTRRVNVGLFFRWASWRYWKLPQYLISNQWVASVERRAGETFEDAEKRAAVSSSASANTNTQAQAQAQAANPTIEVHHYSEKDAPAADDEDGNEESGAGTRSGTSTAVGSPLVKPLASDMVVPPVAAEAVQSSA